MPNSSRNCRAGGFSGARAHRRPGLWSSIKRPKLDVRRKAHRLKRSSIASKCGPRTWASRLAESFETAFAVGSGRWRALPTWTGRKRGPSSCSPNKFACPICNYSLSELETAACSPSNSPTGACPACDGSSAPRDFFRSGEDRRESAFVARRRAAVRGWGPAQRLLLSADSIPGRRHTKFDIEGSLRKALPQKIKDPGAVRPADDCRDRISSTSTAKGGHGQAETHLRGYRSGIWNARHKRDGKSATVRGRAGEVIVSSRPCPECLGTRLNRGPRETFFVDGKKRPRSVLIVGGPRPASSSANSNCWGWARGNRKSKNRQGNRRPFWGVSRQCRPWLPSH